MKSPSLIPELKGSAGHALLVLAGYSALFLIFFAPALLSGSLIGPGDSVFYHQPYFYAEKVLWDTMLSSGFPMMADPQVMTFYPPAFLFSLVPGGWNLFIISAFVLASCFSYGYVYSLTASKVASACGGIIYGMSGFMVAQLDHASIIHNAAWLPLIVWSLEMLRRKLTARWFAAGCVSIACCALAGHSQIFVYSLVVAGAYALVMGWRAACGPLRFYSLAALVVLLGVGLAAIQLIPTLELVRHTLRATMTFEEFNTYSLPLRQGLMFLFPALFGGLPEYGRALYFGEWNLIEMTGYVGVSSLLLAALGVVASRMRGLSIFWLVVALIALLLVFGDATPLAQLAYRLPVINLFRVPARHFFELAFATSVLASLGVAALLEGRVKRALLVKTSAVALILMTVSVILLPLTRLNEYAARKAVPAVGLLPWNNRAVLVPLLVLLLSVALLLYWQQKHASIFRSSLVLLIIALDLSSFGFFYARFYVAPESALRPPEHAVRYGAELRAARQRFSPVDGVLGPVTVMPPNISKLWGVPSASAHGPLIMTRTSQLLSMTSVGNLSPSWKNADDRSLDLLAVRYAFTEQFETKQEEMRWLKEDLNLSFGAGCNSPHVDSAKIELPEALSATKLGVVSLMGCSVDVAGGAEMLRINVSYDDGATEALSLRAGRDTSEWAYDCEDVRPTMKHGRATIFKSFDVPRGATKCSGHQYLATLPLNGARKVQSLELNWTGTGGALTVNKLSLLDERTGRSQALAATRDTVADWTRWRHVEDIGDVSVYENLRVMPRAWLVPEVLPVPAEEALRIIKQSKMPDGSRFDPARTALVEEPFTLKGETAGKVEIATLSSSDIELRTSSPSPAFLILSDIYYPGWRARVDDVEARLYRADFALRGVAVPAGNHIIRLEFKPRTLYYGLLLSSLSLFVIIIVLFVLARSVTQREHHVDNR